MVRYYRGASYPLVSLQERTLMVLANKYVDDVVIGSPYVLSKDLLVSLNVSKVVHVRTADDAVLPEFAHIDPYQQAKELGIFEEIEVETPEEELTINKIAQRVLDNKEKLEAKFAKKTASEQAYYEKKQSLTEVAEKE